MVYKTPRDYATWAREKRSQRMASGADPASIILQSELRTRIPREKNESPADYVKRYAETMNAMIRDGVTILNDQTTADVVPDGFGTADGRYFNLGPGSGATKGEYREFGEWFRQFCDGGEVGEVPERWKKFEKPAHGDA
ncbi:hypothetical protein P171DRAFT_434320 [Karstenula rhodostoma CBS 690.94]|uniref:Uncharacterized protein n=1 Tax=Karstenula rhodostoma CBS 690.94 TaxID=1392251 RepID=A0A9P4PAY2_9PLEO|nr:hypothetical protein P171DRAFT_434320 [Karstenula rhodostoma CBS 690.94]